MIAPASIDITQLPGSAITLAGAMPGPKLVVCGCVHGNEIIGKQVLDALLQHLNPQEICGSITLILGNPAAYARGVRYVDEDLNRLWSQERVARAGNAEPLRRHTEEARVLELLPYLEGAEYALDIHATVQPTPHAFVYCAPTPAHRALARCFEVPYILSPAPEFSAPSMSFCLDNYVDAQRGVGLTLEAGWLQEEGLFAATYTGVVRALMQVGSASAEVAALLLRRAEVGDAYAQSLHTGSASAATEPVELEVYEEIIAQTAEFRFVEPVENFHRVPAGSVFAYDGAAAQRVQCDSYIIFPKASLAPGKEAGYLARKVIADV